MITIAELGETIGDEEATDIINRIKSLSNFFTGCTQFINTLIDGFNTS